MILIIIQIMNLAMVYVIVTGSVKMGLIAFQNSQL